jgi:hypothetical protein
MTFAFRVILQVVSIADETACARVTNAKPADGFGGFVLAVFGATTMNNDLVATLHNENVFHGVTAADSCQINYRSLWQSCKK